MGHGGRGRSKQPALERAPLRGACGSAVKLSVSYVGHSAREKSVPVLFLVRLVLKHGIKSLSVFVEG